MSVGVIKGSWGCGKQTQTAGTIIRQLIRPMRRTRTRIRSWSYTAAATAHTITVRPAIGYSTVSVAAAAAATTITLAAQPTGLRAIATNDIFCIEQPVTLGPTGVLRMDYLVVKPSGIAGLVLTVGALTYAIPAGARVWLFALDSDVCPGYGGPMAAPPTWATTASKTNLEPGGQVDGLAGNAAANDIGVFMAGGDYEPLLWESNNATNAGTLNELQADYLRMAG